jgi:DNA-binding transcriptional ArsR family regulator
MSRNQDYSKKILKILAENKAVSVHELAEQVTRPFRPTGTSPKGEETPAGASKMAQKTRYAINRSLRGLQESGLVESHFSGQNDYARLTRAGRRKVVTLSLESDTALLPHWDGQWRIVLLDLPENRKSERESLRYLLKKAGFTCLKNSAWISPFPFEHLFMNIKKDLGLTTEMMIIVTNTIDKETESSLLQTFQS